MQNHDSDVPGDAPKPDFSEIEPGAEDFRGRYGYGRKAHRPDPEASYSFAPTAKTLPLRSQRQVKPG
jgi:hypothetical protein